MKAFLTAVCVLLYLGSMVLASNSACNSCACIGIKNHWHSTLLPVEEVPRVDVSIASAYGSIVIVEESIQVTTFDASTNTTDIHDERALRFRLLAVGRQLTAAHLHVGSRCVAGPIVAFLTTPSTAAGGNGTSLPTGGILAEGVLTRANLTGPLDGFNIYDLVQEMKAGNVYANVHSTRFPDGEARGQISPLQEDSSIISDLLNSTICKGNYNKFLQTVAANATGSLPPNSNTFGPNFQTNLENSILNGPGPYTVFAPTDDTWDVLITNEKINTTQKFLGRHIVEGVYTFSDFLGKVTVLTTITGVNLTIDGVQRNTNTSLLLKASHQPRVTVNGARIIEPDAVIANNGVLHGISNPITPVCIPTRTAPTTEPSPVPTDSESSSNAAERQRRLQRIRKL